MQREHEKQLMNLKQLEELEELKVSQLKEHRNSLLYSFLQEESSMCDAWFAEIYAQAWFGQWRYHKYDVLNHTRRVVRNFMVKLQEFDDHFEGKITKYFHHEIDGVSKLLLTQLGLIFHDAWKQPIYEIQWNMRGHAAYAVQHQLADICQRFNLSDLQKTYLENIILYHDTPLEEDVNQEIREILQNNGVYVEALLISLADLMACEWEKIQEERIEKRREFVVSEMEKYVV